IEVSNTNLTPEVVEGGNSTRFSFDFTVPNGTKKDDTTTISLPKELDFQRYQEFEVYAPDGQAVAKAVIEPKIKTLTMTYTDYVEKHSDIKGHLEMNVVVDRKVVTTANTVAAEITINNKTKITIGTGKLSYTGTKGDSDKIDFWKYGVSSNNNEIVYLININTSKSTVPDVTISDQLKSPGLQYVEDSFEIQEGNWYKNEWNYWALGSEINVTSKYKDKIEISSDKTSFKVKLGDINGKGYRIKYRVKAAYTLINGEKLNNLAEYYTGTTRRSHASHVQTYQGASGSASGYNYGLIIEKVNEERQLLAGAEFTVTRTATGQVIGKFMTDEKGIVEVTGLLRDEYTITETKAPAGYAIAAPVTRIADNSIVTIIDKKANTDIEGKKTWVDNNDQDGKRPKSIKVNLLANGTIVQTKEVTAENDWSYKFSGLDQHDKDGEKIVYTVSEEKVDGYEMKVEGTNITNTHTPETTQVSGTKTWNDNNDQDGKRPQSITVNLLADGKVIKSQQVTAENDWKYTFTDLPKYANGKEIVYTVEEVKVDGYETKVEGTNITNTHTPETTQVSGTKTWNDNNDQDGKRPKSITVNLLADGKPFKTQKVTAENNWEYTFTDLPKYANGKEIVYTVSEEKVDGYEMKVEGTNITNTHTPETTEVSGTKTWNDNNDQDGQRPQSITVNLLADGKVIKSQQVTAENDWKYTFTDLPKYANNGKEIVYTVTENAVEGYTTTYDKYNITNSYTPGQTSLTVTKAWDDKDNQDGKRPEAIQVQLYANGEKLGEPVTLTADNKWTHTWTGLAKKANKKDIVYTVKEVSKVEGYTTTVGTVENGNVTITNAYKPSTTSIKVNKVWKDKDNQDGLRPTSITVNLLADGEVVKTETITPNADGDWSHTFTDLPEYKNGKKITYTVSEEKVEGYETTVEGTTITNTHTPETTEVAGTKTWNDNNDQDGKRPKSITVN
ncbi:Cna B-type domain-containing protein, partial [Streptococcus ruminantium]|uniref:Cna B-type domain-containing protein n=1 Tax=Streptococcus ruminantium TaxID=1917441 RepID=UPI0015B0FB46